MLDCGLTQGSRKTARQMNTEFAVPPASVDSVVLSHAHIDHSGNLPQLVRRGFRGRIHCTPATADLTRVLLRDSGHIQENEAEFLNRKLRRRGEPLIEPLYTMADAEQCLPLLQSVYYDQPFEVAGGSARVTFRDAGHILGSSYVEVSMLENGAEKRLTFSGDLGRNHIPILRDPDPPAETDALILESTYGNRPHEEYASVEDRLGRTIQRVIERRGKVVIPAFSVGRTQEVVYALNNLWNAGRLPRIPVYVDSPLSANATEIFRHHPECYDEEIREVFLTDPDPFGFEGLIYVRDKATSMRINKLSTPCVIISSSGMCEAGRVLHHLANTVTDPRNAILIVGFQAENTLGRKLVEKQSEVRILGDLYKVGAEVALFNAFSAHADAGELRDFALKAAASGRLKKVFLVHGEEAAIQALESTLAADLPHCEILMPERGQVFEI